MPVDPLNKTSVQIRQNIVLGKKHRGVETFESGQVLSNGVDFGDVRSTTEKQPIGLPMVTRSLQ